MRSFFLHTNGLVLSDQSNFWNVTQFLNCKVKEIYVKKYSSGKKLCLTIDAPNRQHKRFYLHVWEESPIFNAVNNAEIEVGDVVSVYTTRSYYKGKQRDNEDSMREAYEIILNANYDGREETEFFFQLMHVKKAEKEEQPINKCHLSVEELLRKMTG